LRSVSESLLSNAETEHSGLALEHVFLLTDFGSTFTKLVAIEAGTGRLISKAHHLTTIDDDVMVGFNAARAEMASSLNNADSIDVLACSSAGGGLRVLVVGLERDITTEAARRVALNSGGRIVGTVSGDLDESALEALRTSNADIALIVGGTDGGNATALLERANAVALTLPKVSAVVAGNAQLADEAAALLRRVGIEAVVVENVMPEIGTLVAAPAREAIRSVFIHHVIGGKHLSRETDFTEMVTMPTPDAVLTAVELLAELRGAADGSVPIIVVDVGGATTDVYSAADSTTQSSDEGFVPVPTLPTRRTVEADLGLRWSAPGVLDAALNLGLLSVEDGIRLRPSVDWRAAEPGMLPLTDEDYKIDAELASMAVAVAVLRHAGVQRLSLERDGMGVHRDGPDLRGRALLVLTGGIFRAQGGAFIEDRLTAALQSFDRQRHLLPTLFDIVVDQDYVLAACGLLATRDREAAVRLLSSVLSGAL
jgi:uncharacterized protein (TIGR01319 family)